MRWKGRRQSTNVEDRRGMSPKTMVGGGCGTIVIILIVMLLGGNPGDLLNLVQVGQQGGQVSQSSKTGAKDELSQFVAVVLADTEDVWNMIFRSAGSTYRKPKLVLYNDMVQSACGYSSAATGPFYCPGDEKVYFDLNFFQDMQRRLGAHGDFALAYVIAHEVGHHVQKLMGISDQVMAMRGRVSQTEFNQYMVRMELQADFFAGVWAHHAQKMNNILEKGDIDEAVNAAGAVGDDRIQKKSRGYVVPDSFTHGTSAQRARWFSKGLQTGDINQGDTFNARTL